MSKPDMKDDIFAEISSLFFAIRQIIREKLPSDGVHDPNAWLRKETLMFIASSKDVTMQDIARYLHVRAPSATSLIKNLEKSGYISRKASQKDRRVVYILLTPKGKALMKRYQSVSAATMRLVFSKLSEDEIRNLSSILRRLRDMHKSS